jgi:hypothetical protein
MIVLPSHLHSQHALLELTTDSMTNVLLSLSYQQPQECTSLELKLSLFATQENMKEVPQLLPYQHAKPLQLLLLQEDLLLPLELKYTICQANQERLLQLP